MSALNQMRRGSYLKTIYNAAKTHATPLSSKLYMLVSCFLCSSRVLAIVVATQSRLPHLENHWEAPFLTVRSVSSANQCHPRRVFHRMASGGSLFPPQKQEKQPGKEHVMDPHPQYADPNYKPSNKLHGKVAVVTGGDSGIGRAVCHYFALEGATVAFTFTYVKSQEDKDAKDTLQILKKIKTPEAKCYA